MKVIKKYIKITLLNKVYIIKILIFEKKTKINK